MEKNYFCAIEINNIYTSAVVVAFYNKKLNVIAACNVLSNGYADGHIFDQVLFKKTISSLLDEVKTKYKITIDEAILVLPNNDHKVYTASVSAIIKTERQIIGPAQIRAAREGIRKAKISDDEYLVDEVPTLYTLDNNQDLRTMPLNMSSSTLNVKSNIHTLPKDIVLDIFDIVESLNIKILSSYINCDCAAMSVAKQFDLEDQCICIDINQDVTTIAAYAKNTLLKSSKVDFGVKNLVDYLANVLKITFAEALNLFESYFICDIDLTSDVVFDKERNLNEKRISGIVLNRLYTGFDQIISATESLKELLKFEDTCTYNLSGLLNDFESFVDVFTKYSKINVNVNDFNVIGLTNPLYKNCFGAIKKFITINYDFVENRISNYDDEDISLDEKKNVYNKPSSLIENGNNQTRKPTNETKNNSQSRFRDIFDD